VSLSSPTDASTGPQCPRCGSDQLRRSSPHNSFERLLRKLSPYHLFRCGQCHHRGWHPHRLSRHREAHHSHGPGRPLEKRDRKAKRAAVLRAALTLIFAASLGVASAIYLHGCQQGLDSGSEGSAP